MRPPDECATITLVPKTEVRHPDKTASTGAYSAGVDIDGWLYVSGQGPLDLQTGKVVEGTIEEQTRVTLEHEGKILHAAACGFEDVVKCACHLRDIKDFDRFNELYGGFFRGVRPARTTVQSVLRGGIKVDVDCVARIPGILANNDLGESVFGTPALAGGAIYIRSARHLWAFGTR